MNILVLGASGMLGNTIMKSLIKREEWRVHGTIRTVNTKQYFPISIAARLHLIEDIENIDDIVLLFRQLCPNIVINCIGVVKQVSRSNDPLSVIPINSILPHRLSRLCQLVGARLIHISTDCVFSGLTGSYTETDNPDAADLYGRSKLLGEINDRHTITLRTSIIGHELQSKNGLVEWFLSQNCQCKGYTHSIFSGLPTIELANLIRDVIILNDNLHGVYHISSEPISKYELLKLIAKTYNKSITIIPDDCLHIDRSLDSRKFRDATGYVSPTWTSLVKHMYDFHRS